MDSLAAAWDPEQYHDTYTDELKDLIARKAGGEDLVVEDADDGADAEIIDLMAALEASVSSAREARAGRSSEAPARKKASSEKAATSQKASSKKSPSKKATSKKDPSKRATSKTKTKTKKKAAATASGSARKSA